MGDKLPGGCGICWRGWRDDGDRGDQLAVPDRRRRNPVVVRLGRGGVTRRRTGGDRWCGDRRGLRGGRIGGGRESGALRGQPVAAAGASADGWVAGFGEQSVDAQRDAGQPLSSSAPAANEFDRHQHAERHNVEHAERARQHTQAQSDDRHTSMVPAMNRISPLIRT
jgi:hypothetical protein